MVLVVRGNLNLCFVGQVCHRIGVLEDEFFSLGERLLVGHEEVHDVVLQDIWDGFRVREDTLHCFLVEGELDFGDDRSQCGLEQLNDLFIWVLLVRNHDVFPFACIGAPLNQTEGSSIPNAYRMDPTVFSLLLDEFDDSICV